MGNCNQNFENIRDDVNHLQNQSAAASRRIGLEHQLLQPQAASPQYARVIDEEVIQASLVRNPEPVVKLTEKSKSETPLLFPEASSIPEVSEQPSLAPVKKIRPKLQQLDLTFYHSLALPDYQYRPIPQSERHLFNNVETYEMKDNYGVKYLGEWLNNTIHGNGVLLSNTAKYIGQFKNGLKHYHGRQILKNQVYEGMFEGGRRKGEGTRYTQTFTQIGYFDDQLIDGRIVYLDGREQRKTNFVKIQEPEIMLQNRPQQNGGVELYTQKYYEQSQLPPEWQDGGQSLNRRF